MNTQKIVKAVQSYSFNLKKDLQKYTEVQTGKAIAVEYQQIQHKGKDKAKQNENEYEDDFNDGSEDINQSYEGKMEKIQSQMDQGMGGEQQASGWQVQMDDQNQNNAQSIKTYQFNKYMFATDGNKQKQKQFTASLANKLPSSQSSIELTLQSCYGYNSRYKSACVILDENCYCVAIGCCIVLCVWSKGKQQGNGDSQSLKQGEWKYYKFQEHNYQICYLSYNQKYHVLLSGSKGLKPEIIVWNYKQNQPQNKTNSTQKQYHKQLSFVNQFKLPRNSQSVDYLKQINQTKVIACDSISIHRGNSLYFYDIEAGNQWISAIKFKQKIFDICFVGNSNEGKLESKGEGEGQREEPSIWLACDGSIYKSDTIDKGMKFQKINVLSSVENTKDTKDKKPKDENLKMQPISITNYKSYIIIGTKQGQILIYSNTNKNAQQLQLTSSHKIHKGFILKCQKLQQINNKKVQTYLITSGTEDNGVKIHQLQQNQNKLELKLIEQIQMRSYCNSVSVWGDINRKKQKEKQSYVLLGFRDGLVILYNARDRCRKYQKISLISCMERSELSLLRYNNIVQRLMFVANKRTLYQLSLKQLPNWNSNSNSNLNKNADPISQEVPSKPKPALTTSNPKQAPQTETIQKQPQPQQNISIMRPQLQSYFSSNLRKYLNCASVYQDKVAEVYPIAQNKYRLQIHNTIDVMNAKNNTDANQKCIFFIEFQLKKQGKPKIVEFNDEIAAIGTKHGHLVAVLLKKKSVVKSEDRHSATVQQIIFQQVSGSMSTNKPFCIKTVSGSELFHWQLATQSSQSGPKLKTITKIQPLRALKWQQICKYGWETRKIWEKMTHYQDISNVVYINGKYVCVSMFDGRLRVYRYPAVDMESYAEWKLWTGHFRVVQAGDSLVCEKDCEFLVFKIGQANNQ